jgi:hypothetical protein
MRGIKKTIMVLVVLSLIVFFAGQAGAGVKTHVCRIVGCSIAADGTVQILLERQDQMRTKYFDIPIELENMMMAIALTALSMDKTVEAEVDWSHGVSTEILELRVLP